MSNPGFLLQVLQRPRNSRVKISWNSPHRGTVKLLSVNIALSVIFIEWGARWTVKLDAKLQFIAKFPWLHYLICDDKSSDVIGLLSMRGFAVRKFYKRASEFDRESRHRQAIHRLAKAEESFKINCHHISSASSAKSLFKLLQQKRQCFRKQEELLFSASC